MTTDILHYIPWQFRVLRFEITQNKFVLLVSSMLRSHVLSHISSVVQLSHAIYEILLFLHFVTKIMLQRCASLHPSSLPH